ncbi:prolyl oligopeptidase family serine peptidase [Polynucleobacter sp. IMCC 29146]|uniref:dienelactone hydrolase family protein n=1 Tax=Polynucleobacter sp. IMCC 29146 TaxID=2780953 RepID=UPI001F3BB370|nr:prolyl oligopeptidase family serine peptidase [Polynucleobacter sp. IMCC 29146]
MVKPLALAIFFITWFAISLSVVGQSKLPEEVVFVPKKLFLGSVSLETTIFKPSGDGPFPLVIINHGKANGLTQFQPRYRPLSPVRFFLERNYIVLVPMRQGFSKSSGHYMGGGCSLEANGLNQAEDVPPVITFAHQLPYVDKTRTLIVGQSHGGWTTLAYGASKPDHSVKGLINFAGGLRREGCGDWQSDLYKTAGTFGKETTLPSLWLYGDNDSYFSRFVADRMFENYRLGNPNAKFIAYGSFGSDSHMLFTSSEGKVIWAPYVDQFLEDIGLPNKVVNPL